MTLHKEILSRVMGNLVLEMLDEIRIEYAQIVEQESLAALERIKAIIHNDSLSDFDCIEQIVNVFEEIGSTGGSRHDF